MQLICISRGSYGCGKAFAESLARNLGCICIAREELLEKATLSGIAAGKLELACVKNALNERMLLEREHYQAFVTCQLAEAALAGPVVYHGLAGHLLLKSIGHVLRVRVEADPETRIQSVQERLGLGRCKAEQYIEQVDDDRRKWVQTFYEVNWYKASGYDFTINIERANVDSVAYAFCSITSIPEFQETRVTRQALEDLLLASRCRMVLARDERTRDASFHVQANHGIVSVTYKPQYGDVADAIAPALASVTGVKQVCCALAANRILWIQEGFDPRQETFQHVLRLANKWEAAVDLLRFDPCDTAVAERGTSAQGGRHANDVPGVTEQGMPAEVANIHENIGMDETFAELAKLGKAGGRTVFQGSVRRLLASIDRTFNYSLVVLGDVFLGKSKAARAGLSRELANSLSEQLHVAVVQAAEGMKESSFSSRGVLSTLAGFAVRCSSFSWFSRIRRRLSKSSWYMFCVRRSADAEFAKSSSPHRFD